MSRYAPPARDREEKRQEGTKSTPPARERDEHRQEGGGSGRRDDGPDLVVVPGDVIVAPGGYPVGGGRGVPVAPSVTFVRTRAGGATELCEVDGQGLATISLGPRFVGATDPSRSGRSGRLAYILEENRRSALWTVDDRLRKARRLSAPDWGDIREPAWSPDERQLAFVAERDGASTIYIARADGKFRKPVASVGRLNRQPLWSRDGRSLLFIGQTPGGTAVFRASVDGGAAQPLAELPSGSQTDPALSPDGRQLVFVATGPEPGAKPQLCLADPNRGRVLRRLTDGDGAVLQPAFHPRQERIAFSSSRSGKFAIYDLTLSDGSVRRLTPGNDDETCPTWW